MARSLGRYNEGMVSSLNFSRHITRLLRASQRRENKKSLRTEPEALSAPGKCAKALKTKDLFQKMLISSFRF